jgi:hypothetical protein
LSPHAKNEKYKGYKEALSKGRLKVFFCILKIYGLPAKGGFFIIN